jgi:CRISPR-associated endoribonuclease Cas6
MTLGGFVGEMEIEGDLEPLAPLLATAEILHVGKGATFGLGRIEIG